MSKLTRITQRIFGSGAGLDQVAQFGSLFAGAPAFTTDPAVAMSLSNWLTGWFAAAIGGNAPAIEDMNAAMFAITYQIAQGFQDGIPEWDSATTYYIGSFVASGKVFYVSQANSNVGNDPTSDLVNWKLIGGDLMTALGDLVYGDTSGAWKKLAGNTDAAEKCLVQTGNGLGSSAAPVWREIKVPDVQVLSGSGTFTTPVGAKYLRVRMVGGGGGGGGSSTAVANNGGTGTAGGDTTFGTCTAHGGNPGSGVNGTAGLPGTATVGSGFAGLPMTGNPGGNGNDIGTGAGNFSTGGHGGSSIFQGAGRGGTIAGANAAVAAAANSGSGGGGGGSPSIGVGGGGGASGGALDVVTSTLLTTYPYVCGAKGAHGALGTSGFVGADGGEGSIEVTIFYQ